MSDAAISASIRIRTLPNSITCKIHFLCTMLVKNKFSNQAFLELLNCSEEIAIWPTPKSNIMH